MLGLRRDRRHQPQRPHHPCIRRDPLSSSPCDRNAVARNRRGPSSDPHYHPHPARPQAPRDATQDRAPERTARPSRAHPRPRLGSHPPDPRPTGAPRLNAAHAAGIHRSASPLARTSAPAPPAAPPERADAAPYAAAAASDATTGGDP